MQNMRHCKLAQLCARTQQVGKPAHAQHELAELCPVVQAVSSMLTGCCACSEQAASGGCASQTACKAGECTQQAGDRAQHACRACVLLQSCPLRRVAKASLLVG